MSPDPADRRSGRPPRPGRPDPDAGHRAERGSQAEPESSEAQEGPNRDRTRAEEMGIPPLWAVSGGGSGARSKELKRQLAAAEEALESARAEARDGNEKFLRLAAEMENVQRRHRQDRQEQLIYGNAELIKRILPLLDNFHRALEHVPESNAEDPAVQQWVEGLNMVVRQFEDILAGAGVEAIEAVGKPFDPNQHQAVMAEPSDKHEDGQVIAELQRGYRLRDRVLRPSMVKVANNS
ncbi:MAG: nucleotide exchange factor GrpE [Candidatus Dormibacteraeota bacterium]|nr:nucleotide exchange factor GrpE [Candidatus Dormibacteraeota bacterium]